MAFDLMWGQDWGMGIEIGKLCVCVCVRVREREGDWAREEGGRGKGHG